MGIRPKIIEKTIGHGKNQYRVDNSGNWKVLMFGWWPNSNGTPSWRWQYIPEDKVPIEVRRL